MHRLGDRGDHRATRQEDRHGQPIGRILDGESGRLDPEVGRQAGREDGGQQARRKAPVQRGQHHGRIERHEGGTHPQDLQEAQPHEGGGGDHDNGREIPQLPAPETARRENGGIRRAPLRTAKGGEFGLGPVQRSGRRQNQSQ